jgi:hypothetical protein
MGNQDPAAAKESKRFDTAFATRQFEIDLFWKRSLFFWGFIAAAFLAVAALKSDQPTLSLLISGFGLVCSISWTLVNRGSKYWQEQWESKIESAEDGVTGPLFKERESPQAKGVWLAGRPYSVSKLAIAVSDYVALVWLAIFARQSRIALGLAGPLTGRRVLIWATCVVPVIYSGLLAIFGQSTPRKRGAT